MHVNSLPPTASARKLCKFLEGATKLSPFIVLKWCVTIDLQGLYWLLLMWHFCTMFTRNIITNVRHAWLDKRAVLASRRNWKYILTLATLAAKIQRRPRWNLRKTFSRNHPIVIPLCLQQNTREYIHTSSGIWTSVWAVTNHQGTFF
jgi:hypothetical protein